MGKQGNLKIRQSILDYPREVIGPKDRKRIASENNVTYHAVVYHFNKLVKEGIFYRKVERPEQFGSKQIIVFVRKRQPNIKRYSKEDYFAMLNMLSTENFGEWSLKEFKYIIYLLDKLNNRVEQEIQKLNGG